MRAVAAIVFAAMMVLPLRAEPLTVFAAASLKNAFDAIGEAFTRETGVEVVFSYAGTSVLARQIEQGAPADVFVSAHSIWMDYLDERGLINADTRGTIAGNRLVLIAPQSMMFEMPPDLTSANDLLAILGEDGRLAVALVDAVPAGIYAREAMQNLGVWEVLEPRLAQSDNVRSALFLVARGEAPLGIVYASDAQVDEAVFVAQTFPSDSHSAIQYAASSVAQSDNGAAAPFLAFLVGHDAQQILTENGFSPLPSGEGG
ncbi:MAG: molybdate ABC transporter substrate-binding protein [Rhizobiales bacterium]|nr:molybdate ABC transporter substrate-binding protein [Hyphomicrobiales bacterium]MBO6700087.1 molybdate ABC transporter substrate-binding protein [Hyphomicrobiales bacterium]MBO6737748.1 molybdate ABC transporter substrate-binding protein [Hyphomicrobiales bacterium]MBO6913195.1 molybdate ABC transporter substrate-binding protein [Hyphomicrobiales bacterium]MBO6954239.1 molybdate ABC transporter substrate-binding protein [Hyphomicrobiales bacterium]